MNKVIGYYHLKEDRVFQNTFECAAWYENVMVKAGTYPVIVYSYRELDTGEIDGHAMGVYVNMPGVIVSDYFGARYGGIPISGYDNKQNAGKLSSHTMFSYMFSVADSILGDNESLWELMPEYEAKEHGIYRKGEKTDE